MNADPKGLLNLLETHGAELYALLTRLTLRAGVAEDLLQELFLKLRNASGFACADNPKAYAFRTAIHLACDWRRAQPKTVPLVTEPEGREAAPLDGLIEREEQIGRAHV